MRRFVLTASLILIFTGCATFEDPDENPTLAKARKVCKATADKSINKTKGEFRKFTSRQKAYRKCMNSRGYSVMGKKL